MERCSSRYVITLHVIYNCPPWPQDSGRSGRGTAMHSHVHGSGPVDTIIFIAASLHQVQLGRSDADLWWSCCTGLLVLGICLASICSFKPCFVSAFRLCMSKKQATNLGLQKRQQDQYRLFVCCSWWIVVFFSPPS